LKRLSNDEQTVQAALAAAGASVTRIPQARALVPDFEVTTPFAYSFLVEVKTVNPLPKARFTPWIKYHNKIKQDILKAARQLRHHDPNRVRGRVLALVSHEITINDNESLMPVLGVLPIPNAPWEDINPQFRTSGFGHHLRELDAIWIFSDHDRDRSVIFLHPTVTHHVNQLLPILS